MEPKKTNFKFSLSKKQLLIVGLTFLLHLSGILVAFFETKDGFSFNFPFHLLRFFTWWSVHSSILAILALIIIIWKKEISSWLSQFIILLSVIFNLTTFLFCLFHLAFGALKWKASILLNLQSILWHFVAPLLTIYCFYSFARIEFLKKKLIRSILCSYIYPFLYFLYVYILSFFHSGIGGSKSKLTLYLKKYPYLLFQFLAENKKMLFLVWLPISFSIILLLFVLIIWTKSVYDKKKFIIKCQ